MKYLSIFLIIAFSASLIPAQEWSEPIPVSLDTMSSFQPDLIFDNLGVLHCVWSHKIDNIFF